MNREKRASKRINYICEVECKGEGVNRLSTRINDLSTTGAFIDSMTSFAIGATLNLRFRVKDFLIETTAEVRYAMPQIGMGVRFIDLKPEHLAVLESLIEGKPMPVARPVPPPREAQNIVPQTAPASPSVLSGNFAVVSLFDIIQMIENSHLTGTLLVRLPDSSGEIHFNEGTIANAIAGPLVGAEALNRFLGVSEGIFVFKKSSQEYPRAITTTSNTALLLDLLRAKDEEDFEAQLNID
jgi:uncharacterized protein DUF4388/PilZ domain-containing protein